MTLADRSIKRVLMSADTVGGVWTYSLELARALAPYGVEIDLATMGAPLTSDQRAAARLIPNLRLHESTYRLEWMQSPWSDVKLSGEWLLSLDADLKPDLVHLNSYAHGSLPWRVPRIVAGHSCVLSWWRAVKGEDAPPEWDVYRKAVYRGLHAASLVVAPSRAMLAELECLYGPLGPSAAVPNGCDPAPYSAGAKEPFILASGRLWDEAKNIAVLSSVRDMLDWPVCVAGETRDPEGKNHEIRNLRLLGQLDRAELARWLSRASIYCLPARYEPFGLSVLEAALSGCALVLGDIPSLRENWAGAAEFVSPGSVEELTQELRCLTEDHSRRNELSAKARKRALAFTGARMAAGYMDVYRRATERRTAASCV